MALQLVLTLLCIFFCFALGQDDLGLGNGYIDIRTASFKARIVKNAQVLASLTPSDGTFDFLPGDKVSSRARNGVYHWGDITYRYRPVGNASWTNADSAAARRAVTALSVGNGVLARSDLSPTLPTGPLKVTREWLDEFGDIALRFTINNNGTSAVEVGSLGFPAEFNSIFTNRKPLDMQRLCSLSDPYIGMDAGHIRVSPVSGSGAALVVTPLNGTRTPLEAYRNLNEPFVSETGFGSQTFEGLYEWQVYSKAYAENEWSGKLPWNPPSSRIISPGESIRFGVRFSLAKSGVREIDKAIQNTGTPVAVAAPGYIIPRDLPGQLLIQGGPSITNITVSPQNAFTVSSGQAGKYTLTSSNSAWGRARVTVNYIDGRVQTIHYYITKSSSDALKDMGTFLTTAAWFNKPNDPFNRSSSVMTYDIEKRAIVEQDSRAWVAGLSDEGGVGAYLAAVMKQTVLPSAAEIAKLEVFVNDVIWGKMQRPDFGVRKALFFYEPAAVPGYSYDKSLDWTSWTSWSKAASSTVDRAYNYVHVAAAYWSMYRVARAYPSTVTRRNWDWYLNQAYQTTVRINKSDVGYRDVGLMGETVFGEILQDLKREGKTTEAASLENVMRARATLWNSQEIPYGSEMAWDSTGQEGVYYWTKYFGLSSSAAKTVNSVLGYTPNVPHWGWNGNSRRYWDFIYGGKLRRIERQIHHYGSALNSQVLLDAFRNSPNDSYLLRTGYAGSSAPLSNIDQEGFPSAAFHSFPNTLQWDGITGDYGPGFLGMALGAGIYVSQDKDLGLTAFGGILTRSNDSVTVQNRAAVQRRVFIGPLSLLINADAGIIEQFSYNSDGQSVSLTFAQQTGAPTALKVNIWLSNSWQVVTPGSSVSRGGWAIPLLSSGTTKVVLSRV
jgi:hypothetical protein